MPAVAVASPSARAAPCSTAAARHAWRMRATPCCSPARSPALTRCAAAPDSPSSSAPSVGTVERPEDISKMVVNVALPSRTPPSTPRPVPIIHSTAFLQQEQAAQLSLSSTDFEDAPPTMTRSVKPLDETPYEGNLLQWTLKKVDQSLDEIEHHPLPLQQELYDISRGPVGQATGKGLQAAAEITVKVGMEAAKAVAPVGKWALVNGTKAAVGLIQMALVESAKAKEREKNKGKKK